VKTDSRSDADGVLTITVAGEVDMATVDHLTDALREAVIRSDATAIIVDFAEVTFCDSSGIAALDEAYGAATARPIRLRVINVRPAVRRVLEITGTFGALTAP
jgi:anti-anti-sigma factor